VRTIRYYVAQGLLASPGRDGPATRYGSGTVARLRLIKQLQAAHQPLSAIRERLAGLSDDELFELAAAPPPGPPDGALEYVRGLLRASTVSAPTAHAAAAPAPTYAATEPPETTPHRSQWDRIVIEPDIELHVRRPLSRTQNQRVERLLAFARELQEGGST
jgi:DNA-binding transcriptional MerR regulator